MLLKVHGFDLKAYRCMNLLLDTPEIAGAGWLIAEQHLPDGNGISILSILRARGWHGRALLFTTSFDPFLVEAALDAGFEAVLDKPLIPRRLLAWLKMERIGEEPMPSIRS